METKCTMFLSDVYDEYDECGVTFTAVSAGLALDLLQGTYSNEHAMTFVTPPCDHHISDQETTSHVLVIVI